MPATAMATDCRMIHITTSIYGITCNYWHPSDHWKRAGRSYTKSATTFIASPTTMTTTSEGKRFNGERECNNWNCVCDCRLPNVKKHEMRSNLNRHIYYNCALLRRHIACVHFLLLMSGDVMASAVSSFTPTACVMRHIPFSSLSKLRTLPFL